MKPQRPGQRIPLLNAAGLVAVMWAYACGDGGTEPVRPPDPPRPTTVAVTPAAAQLAALGETVQLSAEVRDQNGNVMANAAVSWSSSNVSVAAVAGSGLVTGAANGTAAITASARSASGNATVTVAQVVSAIAVSPPADTLLAVGDTLRLSAEAKDANGHAVTGVEFAWASSDTSVATVDGSGLVTGAANGTATITAASGAAVGGLRLTVKQPNPVVTLTASATSVTEGGALELTVHVDPAHDAGIVVPWAIGADDNPATADADSADFVDGVAGTVTIPGGTQAVTMQVAVSDDADIEPPREAFAVRLAPPLEGAGYSLGAAEEVVVHGAIREGICDRTELVRMELLEELRSRAEGVDGCASVTREHLVDVQFLHLRSDGSRIDSLKTLDFADLEHLRWLSIRLDSLHSLPDGVFADLKRLESLTIGANSLRLISGDVFVGLGALQFLSLFFAFDEDNPPPLPERLFAGLVELRELDLGNPGWSAFPPGLFSGLASLRILNLNGVFSEGPPVDFPAGLFADLGNLEELHLQGNGFEELPAGLFEGVPHLRKLNLSGNPGVPFDIGLRLERTDTADMFAPAPATVQAAAEAGFPFGFEVPVVVVGGAASPDTLVVRGGAAVSRPFSVSPSSVQDTASVHVSVRLPPIPAGFRGLELAAPERLVLFKPSENSEPVAIGEVAHHVLQARGPAATVDLAEYFAEPDGEELAFSVASSAGHGGVNAEIVGSLLRLAPQTVGGATLTVAANDPEGLAGWQDIDLTVLPAPNPARFDVDVVFLGARTTEQERWIRDAADRWERIVVGDLPDVPAGGLPPRPCDKNVRLVVDAIDDVIVFASFENIDVRGRGGGCAVREDRETGLAVLGQVIVHFDLDGYGARITALHEFGHVLLHGNPRWGELLRDRTNSADSARDTHFAGPLAIEAFDSAGGAAYRGGKVPVQSVHRLGFPDNVHWRSSVLKGELMNTSGGTNYPCCGTFDGNGGTLSAVTVQALADLGYEVNVEEADDYALAGYAARLAAAIGKEDGDDRVSLDLANDILRGPVWVVDDRGRVVRILRR